MKYLCLIYISEQVTDAMTAAEYESVTAQCLAYESELRERGQLVAVEALDSVRNATTVRIRNESPVVTDGPFAETREHLAGFFLVETRDLMMPFGSLQRCPNPTLAALRFDRSVIMRGKGKWAGRSPAPSRSESPLPSACSPKPETQRSA